MFLLCPFIKQNNREKLLLLEFQIQNEQSTLSKTLAAGSNCKINFEIKFLSSRAPSKSISINYYSTVANEKESPCNLQQTVRQSLMVIYGGN